MSNLISPELNFREFLKSVAELDRGEMIRAAGLEYRAAMNITVRRGSGAKAKYRQIQDYGIDLRDFIEFLETTGDFEVPLPEAFLASEGYRNKLRIRNFGTF